MQFSKEAKSVLNALYDFTACQRADGSVYGTGGQCRKGREVDLGQVELSKADQKRVSQFATEAGLDMGKVLQYQKEIQDEFIKITNDATSKSLEKELSSYMVEHLGKGDFMTAKVVTIGMEETLRGGADEKEAGMDLLSRLALQRLANNHGGVITKEMVLAQESQTPASDLYQRLHQNKDVLPFWRNQGQVLGTKEIAGIEPRTPVLGNLNMYLNKDHAGMEFRPVPANNIGDDPMARVPWAKGVADRKAVNASQENRRKFIRAELEKIITSNKNLEVIGVGIGKTGTQESELRQSLAYIAKKHNASQHEIEHQAAKGLMTTSRFYRFPNGVIVADYGASVSGQKLESWKSRIREEINGLRSGKIAPNGKNTLPNVGGTRQPQDLAKRPEQIAKIQSALLEAKKRKDTGMIRQLEGLLRKFEV